MGLLGNFNQGFGGGASGGSGSGTVTSVGVTMPSAFIVANTPITTSGDIDVTGAGTTSQYVRGDGSLANFPTSLGGGASVSFYLNGSVNQGTFGGSTYYQLGTTPVIGAGTDFSTSSNGLIAQFITDANVPNQLNVPSGNWNFELFFSASSNGGAPNFYLEVYKYDGASFTLLGTDSLSPENIGSGTVLDSYYTSVVIASASLNATDRIAIRVYVNVDGRTITLHTEDETVGQIITTFTTGLTALNGLTAQVQTFNTGTSGTDFAISSATSIHTFNLPIASAVNTGKLSSSDWSTFNNKPSDDLVTLGQQALGSGIKSVGIGCRSLANLTLSLAQTDGQMYLSAIYIPFSTTLTGARWFQNVTGNYTADNENRIGLYSYSGGNLTLVASTADDVNLWKGSGLQSKAFSSPYVASAGVYYLGFLYNSSAQVTAPSLVGSPNKLNGNYNDFTNSSKINATINSATLSASIAMSGTTGVQATWGMFVY
jgi:hypothetical protein